MTRALAEKAAREICEAGLSEYQEKRISQVADIIERAGGETAWETRQIVSESTVLISMLKSCVESGEKLEAEYRVRIEKHFQAVTQWSRRICEDTTWISVDAKLPEFDEQVLWVTDSGAMLVQDIDEDDPEPCKGVTHWQPLPSPPTAEEK